jgi:Transposase, Mutator family
VRQAGRIVSVAVIIAVGVNADGRREVLGMDIGPSEAETFWTAFLRKLTGHSSRAERRMGRSAPWWPLTRAWPYMRNCVHGGRVEPAEEWPVGLHLTADEVDGGGRRLVVERLHGGLRRYSEAGTVSIHTRPAGPANKRHQ